MTDRMRVKVTGEKNRKLVSNFIDNYWREHYSSPSIREICIGTGISSSCAVYWTLRSLEFQGRILRRKDQNGTSRNIIPDWVISAFKNPEQK